MPKKGECVQLKNYERKINHRLLSADFENVLASEDSGKQNPDEPYTNKYQKHVACSYGYKLVFADNFIRPFKSYLVEDAAYNFINSMIEESKYCSVVMKKHFKKRICVMTKKDNDDFENSTKGWICDAYFDGHITRKHSLGLQRLYKSQNFCSISEPKQS